MRVLVDEDVASRALLEALADAPNVDLLRPRRASRDEDVWDRAQAEGAAVLTGNARDFVPFARRSQTHTGLLLVSRQNLPSDLSSIDIARAVAAVAAAYPEGISGVTLVLNAFAAD